MDKELYSSLVQSGEYEKLKAHVNELLRDSGWQEEVRQRCVETVQQKGAQAVRLEDILAEVTPLGRAAVSDAVKVALLQRIKGAIERVTIESEPVAQNNQAAAAGEGQIRGN